MLLSLQGRAPLQPFFRSKRHTEPTKPVLAFEDVYKSFCKPSGDEVAVLNTVNVTIQQGEFVFITGPSGAGKSTFLRLIYRAETIDEGRILFCGRDVARLSDESVPFLRRNLGIVFQDFKIVPTWTVFENVAVSLEILGTHSKIIRQRVHATLERVGLANRANERAGLLSGGEQQRVAIARAIVSEPALVLADEPTGNLDPALALDILGLFEEIHSAGTTILFATHDRSLFDASTRRVLVIDEGRIIDMSSGLRHFDREESSSQPVASHYETRSDTTYAQISKVS